MLDIGEYIIDEPYRQMVTATTSLRANRQSIIR